MESSRFTATLVVLWLFLLVKVCLSMMEIMVEEGRELTLTCSGNHTRRLKHIWWTSNSRVLSKCYTGNEACINIDAAQFTAKFHHKNGKYTSQLKIHHVTSFHRNQVFKCVDDGSEPSSTERLITLHVYHAPESPVCEAEELSRGRIKITCQTRKVFPDIICKISQEFYNTTDMLGSRSDFINAEAIKNILYSSYLFKEGTTDYNSAKCFAVFCARWPGQYRFNVKLYPKVTKSLVASVDGYTNTVTIRNSDQSCVTGRVNETNGESNAELEEEILISKAQPLTGQMIPEYEDGNTGVVMDTKDTTCENNKVYIKQQLIIIMALVFLLVCNFFFHVFTLLRVRCRGTKRLDQRHV